EDLHLPSEEIIERRPATTIGHVNHVDAGHHLEQLAGQMGRCSGSSRRIIDFARASLGIGDDLGNRLSRDRWIYRHDKWCADNPSDWRDIADEIVVELVVECRIHRVPCANNEQRVTVGRGTHDRLGADIAAAPRPVVDNKIAGRGALTAIDLPGARGCRSAPPERRARSDAPAVSDRLVPARSTLWPAPRQRPRPDAGHVYGGEVSFEPPLRHSIASSAVNRRFGGIVRPSALAVLRVIPSSHFGGCWKGRAPAFSPRRIRSTEEAALRYGSTRSVP